jgi:hypothetical protein
MKHILTLFLSLSLIGCSTAYLSAKPKWPDAIPELTQPCPDLNKIEGDRVAITELLKNIVNNYGLYYQCSLKNDGWNKWYNEQKKIYETEK